MCGRGGSDRKNIPPFYIALVEQWQLTWLITKRRGSNPTGATIAEWSRGSSLASYPMLANEIKGMNNAF